ncbi:hypothetical protein C8Q79DRAFT_962846 [Trametes meyenii]|nr:hypothetical protein C8Q79DRAFT_962846 [Trametes meyenii]
MSPLRLYRPLPQRACSLQATTACIYPHSACVRLLSSGGPLNDPETSPANAPTIDSQLLLQLKRSERRVQDLSQRHLRLERSVRGKTQYGREILDLQKQQISHEDVPFTREEDTRQASTHAGQKIQRLFKGFVIPEPPKPPAEDECCMSGCAVCVYDLYDEARRDYVEALDNLRSKLGGMGVRENEWPPDIRRTHRAPEPAERPDIALSAFEQFEKALKEKKERERRHAAGQGQSLSNDGGGGSARSEGQYTSS